MLPIKIYNYTSQIRLRRYRCNFHERYVYLNKEFLKSVNSQVKKDSRGGRFFIPRKERGIQNAHYKSKGEKNSNKSKLLFRISLPQWKNFGMNSLQS